MALQKNHYDKRGGNTYPESYWRVSYVELHAPAQPGGCAATVKIHGFKDRAHRELAKTDTEAKHFDERTYNLSAEEFGALMAEHTSPGGRNLYTMIYEDVVTKPTEAGATPDDPPVSFFDGAINVLD